MPRKQSPGQPAGSRLPILPGSTGPGQPGWSAQGAPVPTPSQATSTKASKHLLAGCSHFRTLPAHGRGAGRAGPAFPREGRTQGEQAWTPGLTRRTGFQSHLRRRLGHPAAQSGDLSNSGKGPERTRQGHLPSQASQLRKGTESHQLAQWRSQEDLQSPAKHPCTAPRPELQEARPHHPQERGEAPTVITQVLRQATHDPATPQERRPGPPSLPHTHLGGLTALAHPCDGRGKTARLGLVTGSWAGHPAACPGRCGGRCGHSAPKPLSERWTRARMTLTLSREPCPPVQPPGTWAQCEGQGVAGPLTRRPAHPSPPRGPSQAAPFPDEPTNRAAGASHTRDPGDPAWPLAVGKGPITRHPCQAGSAGWCCRPGVLCIHTGNPP